MQRVGIVLAGCGAHDGSDIHETVLVALALERAGLKVSWYAAERPQALVVDHAAAAGDPSAAPRAVLVESARLGRGLVEPLDRLSTSDAVALVVPGGGGLLHNLFEDLLVVGKRARPCAELADAVAALRARGAPLGAVGLGHFVVEHACGALGVEPLAVPVQEAVVDRDRRFAWTPGFLAGGGLAEVATGIEAMVRGLVGMLPRVPLPAGPRGEGREGTVGR